MLAPREVSTAALTLLFCQAVGVPTDHTRSRSAQQWLGRALYAWPVASVKQFQVTFDCAEPERLARFWCEVLGYVVGPTAGVRHLGRFQPLAAS